MSETRRIAKLMGKAMADALLTRGHALRFSVAMGTALELDPTETDQFVRWIMEAYDGTL